MGKPDPKHDPVRLRLLEAGVKPLALMQAIGGSRTAASQMLSGVRGIPRWHYPKISDLLGVPVAELFVEKKPLSNDVAATLDASPRQHREASSHVPIIEDRLAEDPIRLAHVILDIGETLTRIGLALVGRQTAIARAALTDGSADHRATRGLSARKSKR